MSQLNTANQSNPNFYSLGRGKLYFSALTASLPTGGWRDLGNCPNFSINSEEETLEHKSSQSGLAVTDKKLTISRTTNISFDLDELSFDNLADWFSGDAAANAINYTATYTDEIMLGPGSHSTAENSWVFNKWYELIDTSGKRIYNIDAADAVPSFDVNTSDDMVKDTDYLLDEGAGMIMILDTATTNGHEGTVVDMTWSSGDTIATDEVRAFSQGSVTGALKFVSVNPANNDAVREFQFHQVTLASDGDLSLIGDEFSTMSFTGVVEKNETADANSPFVTIRGLGTVVTD